MSVETALCSVLNMHSHKLSFFYTFYIVTGVGCTGVHVTLYVYGCITGNIIRLMLYAMYTKSQAGDRLQVLRHSTGLEYFVIIRYTYMSIIT